MRSIDCLTLRIWLPFSMLTTGVNAQSATYGTVSSETSAIPSGASSGSSNATCGFSAGLS